MKFDVKQSPIHGKGVFARQRIRRGERIGRYLSRRTTKDGTYVLWVEKDDGWFGYDGYGRLRFLNHRDPPNSVFDGLELFALSTIEPGQEITIHYGDEWNGIH